MQTTFPPERLDRLRAIESDHFWFVGRRQMVAGLVPATLASGVLVDVGCGTGATLRGLAGPDAMPVGIDRHPPAHGEQDGRVQGDVHALPIADGAADAVLALDVLEHVDDAAAARELRRVLRPGGVAVVTVPAFPSLWSFRDADAGHRRRYRRRGIVAVLEHAGLQCEFASYAMCSTLPLVVVSRLVGRRGPTTRDAEDRVPPRAVNRALRGLLAGEARWLAGRHRLPFGSSLVVVAVAP